MLGLNRDVILIILEELQEDPKTLYSCLLVNRTWCEMTVPILWRNPAVKQYYPSKGACKILLNVIFSHLSEESRNNLKNQGIDLFIETYQRPLFNYISFWRYLNLYFLTYIMNNNGLSFEMSKKFIIGNEVMKLFINSDTKFVSLSIPKRNLFHISGAVNCFSELECFYCDNDTSNNNLESLVTISTTIKKLNINIMMHSSNPGIIRLIKAQKNLKEVNFFYNNLRINNIPYFKTLEESLIKCADTIQYLRIGWRPVTKFLSYLVNLVSLEIKASYNADWSHLDVSLPLLKFLKVQNVPTNILISLIENTKGYLIEISIIYRTYGDGRLIQKIYQKCPNLSYFRLLLYSNEIPEFANLLINCQFLMGLEIIGYSIKWEKIFNILMKFSPVSLFKFKFTAYFDIWELKLEHLESFLNNWKDRHSMLLHIITIRRLTFSPIGQQQHEIRQKLKGLLKKYKSKNIIEKYDVDGADFKEFEWIQ
jgi:hypothetical protein